MALVVIAALSYLVDRVSKLALVAAALVMNPLAKWAVYAASFWLSSRIHGPVEVASVSSLSMSVGRAVLWRLLVGSVVIAATIAVVGYLVVLEFIRELETHEIQVVETLAVSISEGTQ